MVSPLDAKEQTEIVEDLRTMSDPYGAVAMGSTPTAADLMRTAAKLITAQAERIAELERALVGLVALKADFDEGDRTYERAYYAFYKGCYGVWDAALAALRAKEL